MAFRRPKALVLTVVLAGTLLTLALTASLSRSLIENWQLALGNDADMIAAVMEAEVKKFVFGLEGARSALFGSDFRLDYERFRNFTATHDYLANFAGALGFGFIRQVPRTRMDSYVTEMRKRIPDFEVHPKTDSDPHLVIEYIEPFEPNRPAIGLDVSFEKHRREAAGESARSGRAVLSKKISLVQATTEHHGFLYFLPVYRGANIPANERERLQRLVGWIYAPVMLDKFFASAGTRLPSLLNVHIFSAEDEVNLKLGEPIKRSEWPRNYVERELKITGRNWKVIVTGSQTLLIRSLMGVALISLFGLLLMTVTGIALYAGIERQDRSHYAQKTWLDAVVNSVGHSLIATLPDGTITTFNSAAERIFGYTHEEMAGKFTPELIHDAEEVKARAKALERELGRSVEPGIETFVVKALLNGSDTNEWTGIRKSGERFPMRLTVTAVRDTGGKVVGYVGIAEDMTEQKKMRDIIEGQRQKMIESSKLSLLGEMAGGIAHEINSPLTAIIGSAEALAEGAATGIHPPQVEKSAQSILKTAWRIAKIVKSLRQFSRDATHDAMTDLDLKAVVDSTLELCHEKLERANIRLKIDLQPDLKIFGREVELSQVLMNLISNSIDAISGQSEPWIEIRAYTTAHNRTHLSVTDSGTGIPKHISDKIMIPFFTTKDMGKGTGLGLSISKNIVENHYGALIFDEHSPHTRFIVDLPLST